MRRKLTALLAALIVLLSGVVMLAATVLPQEPVDPSVAVAAYVAAPLDAVAVSVEELPDVRLEVRDLARDAHDIAVTVRDDALAEEAERIAEEQRIAAEKAAAEAARKAAEEAAKKAAEEAAKKSEAAFGSSTTSVKALGVVSGSDVRMRAAADGSSAIITTLGKGAAVAVTGIENGWYQVKYDGKSGYMSAQFVDAKSSASGLSANGKVTGDSVNVRSAAATSGSVVTTLSKGAGVTVTGFEKGWYAVTTGGTSGYVSGDYVALVSKAVTAAQQPAAQQTETPVITATGTGAEIAAKALEYVGYPYKYGGEGPNSFDCSGLTKYIYGLYGVTLYHGSIKQGQTGIAVDKSELQPGDLVLFYGSGSEAGVKDAHVGIYIGDDQFVHASTYGVGVIVSSLNTNTYIKRYSGARRIIY
ncbi:MAG: SH3 domain-containing protein [Oscillospiraceae bacterium]|nr:SH3 domain-containing protein [Oscillospiraceae bacterium]